jgi:adenylate kinase family enzyme
VHFDFPVVLQKLLQKKVKNQAIWEYIYEGNIFDDIIIMDILEQLVHTEEVAFRGYVLDGFPFNLYQVSEVQNWLPLFYPDYIIHLDVNDNEDLISKFEGTRVDYLTGGLYDAQQIHKFLNKAEAQPEEQSEEEVHVETEEQAEEEENPLDEAIVGRLVADPEYDREYLLKSLATYASSANHVENEFQHILGESSLFLLVMIF